DGSQIRDWSVAFVDFFNEQPITVENSRRMIDSSSGLIRYVRERIREHRERPREDYIGILVKAATPESGFTDDDIIANTILLLLAGHVAVRNLIGNAVWLLLTHPDQLALWRADPSLLHGVTEEPLRWARPVTMIARLAANDLEVRGQTIRKGQMVQLSVVSATRDPEHFADADRFDVTRRGHRALSFAYGPHTCIGAGLAVE